MKDRVICILILCIIAVVSYRLFFEKSQEEVELNNYVTEEYAKIFELEEELGKSYETVIKKYKNNTNDFIQYVNTVVLVQSDELINIANKININNPRLKKIHNNYLDAIKEENEALKYFEVARVKETPSLYTTAWDKIENANHMKYQYFNEVKELADEFHMKDKLQEDSQGLSIEFALTRAVIQ